MESKDNESKNMIVDLCVTIAIILIVICLVIKFL